MLVHLDTDIGGDTDDLCALAYLLARPDVDLVGVTTVIDLDGKRAGYARYALDLVGRSRVPVVAGAVGSLGGFGRLVASGVPGLPHEPDMWPEPVPALPARAGAALDLLEHSLLQGATVVGIGTYTNLAMLETLRPGILSRATLVLMGFHLGMARQGYPQWGPEMDWNVQLDAVAARILLERCSPTLVPLGVTLETFIRTADLTRLRGCGPLGALLAAQAATHGATNDMPVMGQQYEALPDDLLNFHYDPLACAVATGWDGARLATMPIALDTQDGWLVGKSSPAGREMQVVTEVDGPAFNRHWLDTICRAWG